MTALKTMAEDPQSRGRENSGAPARSGAVRKKYMVFVMEDSASDKEILLRVLRKSPHVQEVSCFGNGEELLKHLEDAGYYYERRVIHDVPALIMLDVYSPGVNGFEVLKALKDHPMTRDIPVIMMTGDLSSDMRASALKLKASAYLLKPLNLDDIHDVMSAVQDRPAAF